MVPVSTIIVSYILNPAHILMPFFVFEKGCGGQWLWPRHLIGLKPSPMLNAMLSRLSDSDVAKLVYRDNIKIKHGNRKRLATEIAGKPVASLRDRENQNNDEDAADSDPLSKALVAYLVQAPCPLLRKTRRKEFAMDSRFS